MIKRELTIRVDKTISSGRIIHDKKCNLDCIWCHHDYVDHEISALRESISNAEVVKKIRIIAENCDIDYLRIKISGDGEPLLNSDEVCDLIKKCKDIPINNNVGLTTNGTYLKHNLNSLVDSGLDSINISLSSLDPMIYTFYSGSNSLLDVTAGIQESLKHPIKTKVNVIFSRLNFREIDDFLDLARNNKNLTIKFFDLIIVDRISRRLYLSLSHLQNYLDSLSLPCEQKTNSHVYRTYSMKNGGDIQLKISNINLCPQKACPYRHKCVEGCRSSIRLRSDGMLQLCGARLDKIYQITHSDVVKSNLRSELEQFGKIIEVK